MDGILLIYVLVNDIMNGSQNIALNGGWVWKEKITAQIDV
jgi:hypothetical protein